MLSGNGASQRDNGAGVSIAAKTARKETEIPMEGDFKNF